MSNRKPIDYLDQTVIRLKEAEAKIAKLDGKNVEQDIAARRAEADVGWEFAQQVDEIEVALKQSRRNLNLEQWCKRFAGVEITTMRRRKRLYKHWNIYEVERRKVGQCNQSGLLFALSLIHYAVPQPERTGRALPVRWSLETSIGKQPSTATEITGCEFITGDALIELPRLPAGSVHTIVTSPPYWPTRRLYDGTGIGFEKTLEEYIANLVAVFRQARRVLRDDGVLWIVIDDSYARPGGKWRPETVLLKRPTVQKAVATTGMEYPSSTSVRPLGNLLLIPARLTMALQDDGWLFPAEIIWHKGPGGGRPESVTDRVSKTHEKVLMFAKRRDYFYEADAIREPLARDSLNGNARRDFRHFQNPMGRNAGSVWTIAPSGYRGSHPATMPEELVRQCLLASCPENGTVLDPFGGAGTTALAAVRLGRHAISIDVSEKYTQEAKKRIAAELDVACDKMAAD